VFSVLCVLCCFILLCHGTISVLLYSFSMLPYSSLLLYCSFLFILLCCSTSYVCVLYCIYCTSAVPPGVNPIAVNKYLSIYLSRINVIFILSLHRPKSYIIFESACVERYDVACNILRNVTQDLVCLLLGSTTFICLCVGVYRVPNLEQVLRSS
jgi:hypothetical protein